MSRSIRLAPAAVLAALLAACSGGGSRPGDAPAGADPVISTRSLDVMLTGLAVQVQLEAAVAAPPSMWTFDPAPPASVSWLSLSIDGLLSGTPPAVLMPAEHVTVRVTDAARHTATVTLAVEVHGCDASVTPTKPCFAPSANACTQGVAICAGGAFGACQGGASTDAGHCGAQCGPCGAGADRCYGNGDTCRCGDGAPCTGANTDAYSCTSAGGAPACDNRCKSGWGDCDGDRVNGCETPVTSTTHCGACNAACEPRPNASASCPLGACTQTCNGGWGDCDGDLTSNGCESPLTSNTHCGACNQPCTARANTQADCSGGTCARPCIPGYGDCDGVGDNGCERPLTTPTDCGGCNRPCTAAANQTASCSAEGVCSKACGPGYGDCDGNAANGCETATSSSLSHCGACNHACTAPAGGTVACVNGQCVPSCPQWYGLDASRTACVCAYTMCGSVCTLLDSDVRNCGRCGNRCPSDPANGKTICYLGLRCDIECDPGFAKSGYACLPSE